MVAHDTVLNRFVFEDVARRPDFEVVFFRERRNPLVSLLKSVRMALGNPRSLFAGRILPPELREALASAGPGDTLLLWSVENRKYVSMCAAEASRAGRIVSWLWNPMRRLAGSERECRRYIGDMDALGVEVATFDPSDAALLHARLLPQVHRRAATSAAEGAAPQSGALFVGKPKGRGATLARLEQLLAAVGMNCDFYLVGKSDSIGELPPSLHRYLHSGQMDYAEVLRRTTAAACVLDIVQPGQRGVTLRSLEAVFYGRKLITNNLSIKEQDFYHPDNVWVLDDPAESRTLREFLAVPFRAVAPEIIARHQIGPWLDNL